MEEEESCWLLLLQIQWCRSFGHPQKPQLVGLNQAVVDSW